MGVFAGTERQCTEDEHDDETIPKLRNLGLNLGGSGRAARLRVGQVPSDPGLARRPRLGRSLALPGASPYRVRLHRR